MEQRYFSDMLAALANRASLGTVSWLGFANAPLRRHLMEVFSRPYGDTGNFLADPTFEAVFSWAPGPVKMGDLAGKLLTSSLIDAMDKPADDVHGEYRFPKDRVPYAHQLAAWRVLSQQPAQSVVVTSGTGSGKTECFMVPILDRLAREQAKVGGQLVGIRALFLYPLNALINSQRDRLRAWTSGFGRNVRFCLYNGVTPDSVPAGEAAQVVCEVLDRRTLRASPPPILVTNATMLEYMLVRTQDANILQASQGKLEWIVLDEAHTYVGSQAAELALLIRRVIHAFGVHPGNVRFIATSATIGDPDGAGGEGLRGFLAQIAGVDVAQVHVMGGARQVPHLPTISHVRSDSISDLCLLDAEAETTSGRYQGLVSHGTARKIRDLFVDRKASPVARLSEVCSVIFGPAPAYTLDQQQGALDWLDMLTTAMDVDGTPFLPLRGHLFHQTLSGLWCCADSSCSDKHGTKLEDPGWPFGKLFLAPRNHCTCGSPAYELVACEECGAIFLNAEERHGSVAQPIDVAGIDEFELETEPDDAELPDEADENAITPASGHTLLIANRPLLHTGDLYVHRTNRSIVEATDAEAIRLIVQEDSGDGLTCPSCNARSASEARLFRKARIGAPFLLGGLLPTLLEFAPDGENPADRPYRGRRLLTFSDSRQGTARLAAKLQQDSERTKARSLIYHHALAKFLARTGAGSEQIQAEIAKFEAILATPGMPDAATIPIVAMLKDRRIFEHEHKKLRSRKEDRTCPGSTNRWAIKEGIVLGHQLRTDVLEMQLKDVNGQWISDRIVALTLAVALRDSLASLIGVQASELGCDVQEMRADEGERCQSIFIFDRFAAGYASGSEHLINAMFRDAVRRLDCPKGCDSSCPHCVLDFDQRFESSSLNRHMALAVVSAHWLDMLKLPDELCYFGDSSRVEFSGINQAVLRESGRRGAVLTRLYVGGSGDLADFAPSNLRLLGYRLAALSRAVQVIIEKAHFDALSEADRFSLASLADHPNVTVHTVSSLPSAGDVEIVADVLMGNRSVAWACADKNIRTANTGWGASESPLVVGEIDSIQLQSKGITPDGIRPSARIEGDREIVLHRELDGDLQGFGKRFWKTLSNEHKGAAPILQNAEIDVVSIQYSDRYLFTPVSIALLLEIVAGLREIVGPARWDNPNVAITTTQVRGGAESRAVNTVYAEWRDSSVRDAVIEASFRYLGIAAKLKVLDKFVVQHGRVLDVGLSSGKHLIVRLDQGVSYWRVISPAHSSKKFSTWFEFGPTGRAGLEPTRIEEQAKRVAEMAVVVEGGALPTEMFVKIRTKG